jgi:hypothetical protein
MHQLEIAYFLSFDAGVRISALGLQRVRAKVCLSICQVGSIANPARSECKTIAQTKDVVIVMVLTDSSLVVDATSSVI